MEEKNNYMNFDKIINFLISVIRGFSRVILSVVVATVFLYMLEFIAFPPSVKLILLKGVLPSIAVVHAHFAGKLLLPHCDWNSYNIKPIHIARISFYVVFIYAYSLGG